jgi:tetratricopeptide (TPR) repeat protein
VWLAELSRLLPELRERYPDLPPLAPDETTTRTRLYEALVRLVQALAERNPVVLFVDDVQWADAASMDVLQYATRRWAESQTAVLVLVTLRSESLADGPTLGEWLAGLRRGADVVDVELGPLSLEDTLHLLQRLAGTDKGVAGVGGWLFRETGGQPFFLIETLRALIDRGLLVRRRAAQANSALGVQVLEGDLAAMHGLLPPGIRDVVAARLARLSTDARAILSAGAVLGHKFTFEQVCRVTELSENVCLRALEDASRAHMLGEVDAGSGAGAYSFTHDKIRDVVIAETGGARLRVYHRRAYETLSEGASAAELARHALVAGLDEPAVRLSLQAGDDAMRLLAGRDAINQYGRALEIAERRTWPSWIEEARGRRARAFASVAYWADAKRDLESMLATIDAGNGERRAEVLEGLAEASFWLMDVPSVHRYAGEAVELAARVGRDDLGMAAHGWRGGGHGADGRLSIGIAEFDLAVQRARELAVAPPANVLTFHALTLYWLGRLDDAIERSRAGVEAARKATDPSVLMYSLPHLGLSLASRGRYTEALKVFDEARWFGREYGVSNLLARSIAMSTGFRLELGDFAGAEELSHEARDLALSGGWSPTAASASIDLLFNYVWRGDLGKAERVLADVAGKVETAAGFHGWLWRLRLAEARAEIAAARREWEDAVRLATAAIGESRACKRR